MPRPPQSHNWSADSSLPRCIVFRHPGYSYEAQPLFTLPACDESDTLDHELARVACALVACNRYDGYLTLDQKGDHPVDGAQAHIVFREDGYFFHVPGNLEYPVYPSFRHWKMPSQLPESWIDATLELPSPTAASANISKVRDVVFRDVTCRITDHVHGTQVAHIIPAGESEWQSTTGILALETDETAGAILLRADVHKLLDARLFTIIPRKQENGKRFWVTYIMRPVKQRQELMALYHDRQTQPLYGIKAEYLFCRFAWTILHFLDKFLKSGFDRWLNYRVSNQERQSGKVPGQQCRDEVFTRRGRSQSPTKRKRQDAPGQPQNDERDESESDEGGAAWDTNKNDRDGEESRGRKRRRTCSPCAESRIPSYPASLTWSTTTLDPDPNLEEHQTADPTSFLVKTRSHSPPPVPLESACTEKVDQ